jgi:small subunit ribosomal protein S1
MARTKKTSSDSASGNTDTEAPVTETKDSGISAEPQAESSRKTVKMKQASAGNPQTMDELLSLTGYTLKGIKKGQIVEGVVTHVTPKEITIDIGGKAEGVVIDRELTSYRDALMNLKPGDKVTSQVIVAENDRGQAVLSLRKSIFEKQWLRLAEAQKNGEAVEAVLKDQVRGGVLVDVGGLRGYIPQSQLESGFARQLDKSSGRRIQVKVVEVDQDTNRLVLSQRALAEEEALTKQKAFLSEISEGDTVQATITGVVPFGAFAKFTVTKDGKEQDIEGLIHISEIAWEKVEDPNQYLKTGDVLKVKIIGLDMETGKLTMSLKQLLPDPWEHVMDMFEKDQEVAGTVTRVTPYGVFVSLSPGIEGLIHISKISPGEEPKPGNDVTCIVEDVKGDQRKISLTLALTEKPIGYR